MVYAGLPYEDRGRRENTKFIGCVPKKEGMSSMSFIPGLVADMKELERGVIMYSCVYEELVIVKAPLLFITADNPAHNDICGLLQQTTVHPCRKCYYEKPIRTRKQTIQQSQVTKEQLNQVYTKRTRHHYTLAASNVDHTPIEALHCIPLGVVKYLVEYLVQVVLAGPSNKSRLESLEEALKVQASNKAYGRTFRNKLRHVGSFLERDFKILIQTLPDVIASEFTDPVVDEDILRLNQSLTALEKLCSLVFVRQVLVSLQRIITLLFIETLQLASKVYFNQTMIVS